ncbi:MAG: ARMT1-like domain-containing protein [Lentisphaerae bacterium]|nr:ARMT1-like domain-containing protein [Lentisphaerota bacterium]
MQSTPECLACLMRQALNTAGVATTDPALREQIMRRVARHAAQAPLEQTPAALSRPVYRIVSEITGVPDPYRANKARTNREALQLLPALRDLIAAADDPLNAALHAAVAGNVIDLGIGHNFDIARDVADMMHQPFAVDDSAALRTELRPGRRAVYLGDNAGEIVFDTLLVDQLLAADISVTYTVKSGPIINDATMIDARAAGMTGRTRVIETGGADIGVNWNNVSEEFRQTVSQADFIIAKGHGNFETCEDRPENFYFLLKAKCPIVARQLGCREGDINCAHRPA